MENILSKFIVENEKISKHDKMP